MIDRDRLETAIITKIDLTKVKPLAYLSKLH